MGESFNSNLLLVETEKAMMRAVDEVIIVADSTKFGHQSLALLCELGEIHRMVVDDAIDKHWLNKLAAAGVDVRLASVKDADEHQDDEYQDDEYQDDDERGRSK